MVIPRLADQHNMMMEPMQIDMPEHDGHGHVNREDVFIVENPTLDLDAYVSNYKGITKLQRLMFIAKHCPIFAVDALKMCANAVRSTHNVDLYREVMTRLTESFNQEDGGGGGGGNNGAQQQVQGPDLDNHWVETTSKRAIQKLDKLDQDLKTYKNNSIKESIRRGHDDLGDHYLDCGDYSNALKCYSRARDYCICAQHIVNMCMNVISVSLYMHNWPHVQTYVHKAESVPDLIADNATTTTTTTAVVATDKQKKSNAEILAKLKCASGLAELAQRQYKNAARLFLQVSFDHLDYSEILSAQDVAIYGGICALATFDREELQKKVLSSSSFKQFLELQPQLRDILHKFYSSQYAVCLKLLDTMKDNLLLDIFLSPHVDQLYTQIRNRSLIQYFSPYVSADLNKMAASFNTSVASLEDELTQLILDAQISARIDSRKKILYARDVDHRCSTFLKAAQTGAEYEARIKTLMLRTVVLQHQVQVKSPWRDDDATR